MPLIDDLAARLGRTKVLVVGDLMLDCYYWGDVGRISPEAPVPVVKVNQKTYRLGGAGNVAANLSGLGCSATVIGLIGQDAASGQLRDMLADFQIEDRCIADPGKPTTTKTRVMASKQQVVRLDEEAGVVYYMARDGDNHMKLQLHRVDLDGGGDVRLTDPAFNHTTSLSPDGRHFVGSGYFSAGRGDRRVGQGAGPRQAQLVGQLLVAEVVQEEPDLRLDPVRLHGLERWSVRQLQGASHPATRLALTAALVGLALPGIARIEIDSAGTGAWHVGEPPDMRARAAGEQRGLDVRGRARKVVREDFERFDYVNPDAPKGGTISFRGTGASRTFDSLNRFILKGEPAQGSGVQAGVVHHVDEKMAKPRVPLA